MDAELMAMLIRGFCEREFQGGVYDRGFALGLLPEFIEYIEENGYEIVVKK